MTSKLSELLDVPKLKSLLDTLYDAYGIPSAIIDSDGVILTGAGWQEICTNFHRQHPDSEKRCIASDTSIAEALNTARGVVCYTCPHGLTDSATPIVVDDEILGNVFTGQLFLEPPDEQFFRAQARQYGFDEGSYLAALHKVPVITREQLEKNLKYLSQLTELMASMGQAAKRDQARAAELGNLAQCYRSMLETTTDGFWMIDGKGRTIDVNQTYCAMIGYSRDEMFVTSVADIDDVETAEMVAVRSERITRTGFERFEAVHRRKDGTLLDVEVSVSYIAPQDVYISFVRNISGNRQAEKVLQESERKYRALIETTGTGFVILDDQGRVIDANKEYARLSGHSMPQEILGRNVIEWTADYDQDRNARAVEKCFVVGEVRNLEIDYVDTENHCTPVEINATVLETAAGKIIVTLCRDITERKSDEEKLRLNEVRLHALLQLHQMSAMPLNQITDYALEKAVAVTGSTIGYLAFTNEDESLLTMHSWTRSAMDQCQIIDKPIEYRLETTGLWGEVVRQRRAVITNDYPAENPLKKGYPEGHVHLSRHMNIPVFDGNKIVAVAGVGNKKSVYDQQDIQQLTLLMDGMWKLIQRKQAEDQIRQLNEKLEQRVHERTAELESFCYTISHDLRAPLRAIDGFTKILDEDYGSGLDTEGRKLCVQISRNAVRMGTLIDDLLAFSRMSRVDLHKDVIDMTQLVRVVYNEIVPPGEQGRIDFRLEALPQAYGDRNTIRQVWSNLLENAVKYSSRLSQAVIEVAWQRCCGEIVYFVRDNGAGFDMAYGSKLFGVFQRLHNISDFPGTGVGLAIVERIIRRHGGRIWAEGVVDQGATFFFSIGNDPASPEPPV